MDTKKTPLAVAVFAEIVYILCLLFVAVAPNFAKTVYQSTSPGMDFTSVWNPTFTAGSIILGIIATFVLTYILVWIFVIVYNSITK